MGLVDFPGTVGRRDGESVLEGRRGGGALLARARRGLREAEAAAVSYRAVLFDLFDTLVWFDRERLPEVVGQRQDHPLHRRPTARGLPALRPRRRRWRTFVEALQWSWQEAERLRGRATARWRRPSAWACSSDAWGSSHRRWRPRPCPRSCPRTCESCRRPSCFRRTTPRSLTGSAGAIASRSCPTSTTRRPRGASSSAKGIAHLFETGRGVRRGGLAQAEAR